jgi:NIMA (never in mitosis gene a)-related kinase
MCEKVKERIRILKMRCENGLGHIIYEKALNYVLLNNKTIKPHIQRKDLIEIMGEDNIGFWHLID